jgi:hypothetical protein
MYDSLYWVLSTIALELDEFNFLSSNFFFF